MKKLAAALLCAIALSSPAVAQWQVQNDAIPAGRGSGAGFKTIPSTVSNSVLWSSGSGTPSFSTSPVLSNLRITAGGYLNFGPTLGVSGYGFRDNAGRLEFKNSAGAWVPIQVNTDLYAATYGMTCDGIAGTDNAAALGAALDAAIAANARLILPPGYCRVGSAISKSLTGTQVLWLQGAGQENTVLHFSGGGHGLTFGFSADGWWPRGGVNGNMVQVTDLTITTANISAFNGLTINCNGLHGRPQPASTGVRNVTLRGVDTQSGWGFNVIFDGCYGTNVDNVTIFGDQTPGNLGHGLAYQNSGGAGQGGTQHYISNVAFNFLERAMYAIGDPNIGDGVEGFHVDNFNCVNVLYCFHWDEPGVEPVLHMVNGHMNILGGGAGVIANNIGQIQITNVNAYMLGGPATAFFFSQVRQLTMTNNTIFSNNASSVGIDISNPGAISMTQDRSALDVNTFGGTMGIGIRLNSNVQFVTIGMSNVFSSAVTSPVVNSGNNNLIAWNTTTAVRFQGDWAFENNRWLGWRNAANSATIISLQTDASDNLIFDPLTDHPGVFIQNSWLPGTNLTWSLGTNALRWSDVWTANVNASGNVTAGDNSSDLLTINAETNYKTIAATGAGFWLDGNATTKRAFFGMAPSTNNTTRLFSAALSGDVMTWDIANGHVGIRNNVNLTALDSGGTARRVASIDGSNVLHIGATAGLTSTEIYGGGSNALSVASAGGVVARGPFEVASTAAAGTVVARFHNTGTADRFRVVSNASGSGIQMDSIDSTEASAFRPFAITASVINFLPTTNLQINSVNTVVSSTMTIRAGGGAADCTVTVNFGLITAETCP